MKRIVWSIAALVTMAILYGYLAGSHASPMRGLIAFLVLLAAWWVAMRQIEHGIADERRDAVTELAEQDPDR